MNVRVPTILAAFAALALVAGCAKGDRAAKAPLTEHQRDSVLSRSALPGAGAVGGAMKAADKEAEHAAQMDSLTN